MEMPGIEPGASYMQSMRSTTELHPHLMTCKTNFKYYELTVGQRTDKK